MYFSGRIHSNTYTTINMKGDDTNECIDYSYYKYKGGINNAVDMHWVHIIQLGLYGVYECIYLYTINKGKLPIFSS